MKATIQSAFVAILLCSSASAFALNMCTDDEGKISYQDAPCAERSTNPANNPIAARTMTAKLALDTVAKYYATLSKRDYQAAALYLSEKCTISFYDRKGNLRNSGPKAYLAMFKLALDATKSYTASARCGDPKVEGDRATLVCRIEDKAKLSSHEFEGKINATYTVGLEGGVAKFMSIVPIKE